MGCHPPSAVHSTHCRFNLNAHVLFSLRVMVPKLLVPCGHLNINNSVSHSFWDIKAITINNKDHSWVEQQPLLASVHHNTLSMQHYVLKWRRVQDGCTNHLCFCLSWLKYLSNVNVNWCSDVVNVKVSGCSGLRSFSSAVIYGRILFIL